MSSQEELPAYVEATTGNEVPPYSDGRQPKQTLPKPSRMATLKHIIKGDAHKNHMAALAAAASCSGVPPQPRKKKVDKQSASKDSRDSSRTPTWKLIATGEVHKYNPRFRDPGL